MADFTVVCLAVFTCLAGRRGRRRRKRGRNRRPRRRRIGWIDTLTVFTDKTCRTNRLTGTIYAKLAVHPIARCGSLAGNFAFSINAFFLPCAAILAITVLTYFTVICLAFTVILTWLFAFSIYALCSLRAEILADTTDTRHAIVRITFAAVFTFLQTNSYTFIPLRTEIHITG